MGVLKRHQIKGSEKSPGTKGASDHSGSRGWSQTYGSFRRRPGSAGGGWTHPRPSLGLGAVSGSLPPGDVPRFLLRNQSGMTFLVSFVKY